MARLERLELPTRCLEGSCSIHLSYRRVEAGENDIGESGFEPPTSCSQGRRANRAAPLPVPSCRRILTELQEGVKLAGGPCR
jgi:hypothetical protein